ncbi:MAG: SIS domain-containing protein, partial [Thermoleophilia bacterium]
MNKTIEEIESQPACWRRAAGLAGEPEVGAALPEHGVDVAVVGCGTSFYIAQAYAATREARGLGRTDAFAASEFPTDRAYAVVVAISRSGTTSEVAALLAELSSIAASEPPGRTASEPPGRTASVLLTAVADSPCARFADNVILLHFADEESVVQTRFATSALVLLRASLGDDAEAGGGGGGG